MSDTATRLKLLQAQQKVQAEQPRTFGQTLYENVIGSGEVDTPGERIGAAIGDASSELLKGAGRTVRDLAIFVGSQGRPDLAADASAAINPRTQFLESSPETTIGEYAGTVGEFLPGGMVAKAPVAAGVLPGVMSEAAGQFTEGMTFPEGMPLVGGRDVEPFARTGAAVAGPVVANAARSAITPNPADPARVSAAAALKREGVPVTAGQKTGSEALKYREAIAPRTTQIVADQNQAFTRAALRRIGVQADRATPEVMRQAKTSIGNLFDDVQNVSMSPVAADARAALKVTRDYAAVTAKPNISPIIRNTAERVVSAMRSGDPISGTQYKNWRSQLSRLTVSKDTQLANAAGDMIDVLDDAMARSVAATGNKQVLQTFTEARRKWRDYKAIETAVSRAGEDAAAGILSPQILRNAVAQQGRGAYVLGDRDLGELARQGATVTGKLPQTGAFPRTFDLTGGSTFGSAAGAATYGLTRDPAMSTMVGLGAMALPTARNAIAASPAGQAYLGNQLMRGRVPASAALYPLATALMQDR